MKQKLSSFDFSLGCDFFCFFFFCLPPETHSSASVSALALIFPASSGNRRGEERDSRARGCWLRLSRRVCGRGGSHRVKGQPASQIGFQRGRERAENVVVLIPPGLIESIFFFLHLFHVPSFVIEIRHTPTPLGFSSIGFYEYPSLR